jgi:hypothetical protein
MTFTATLEFEARFPFGLFGPNPVLSNPDEESTERKADDQYS